MKTLFLFSAEAGGEQRLVFSGAQRMVPPHSEDTLLCAQRSLDILTASLPLHPTLTFQDLGGFLLIRVGTVPRYYKIRSSLKSSAASCLSGAPGGQDAPRGPVWVLVPADGIWREPNPQQLFQPPPPCVAAMTWVEITNFSTGTPQEAALINWPVPCCAVSVILSIQLISPIS